MRCHSTSGSSGSQPMTSGASACWMAAAAISGGCRPWQSASPQPTMPSSVLTSTIVAPRLFTQPCENANGCSSGERRTWTRMPLIFMPASQTLPGVHLLAFRVGELSEEDEQQVGEGPDAESAESEKLEHCGARLAGVKAVNAEDAEQ